MDIIEYNKTSPDKLLHINAHPRDKRIIFDEGPHTYTVDGVQDYTSVTTYNHQHFSHFDADAVIDGMLRGKNMNDPKYKYYGMTREEIKAMWAQNGKEASGSGTKMHYDIECFYNDMPVVNDSIEYQFFENFRKDFPLKPFRTEWIVFDEDVKIAGSIDMVFENPDGTCQIYDWKRVKEIKYQDDWSNKMAKTACIKHLPDTNFWHYSLQLNTYREILERKYDKVITDMYLVCMHPENPTKNYVRIQVQDLRTEVQQLFKQREKQIQKGAI
jgi:ATP-dependent exoDNAse (exonuclease V) beta subunit